MLPEFEQRQVERLLDRFYDRRLLAHVQHQIRLHHTIHGNSVTLFEIRPGFDKSAIWVKSPIARFRFDPVSGLWSLYWHDQNRRWRRYGDLAATRNLESLISEVDRDPTSIFWGEHNMRLESHRTVRRIAIALVVLASSSAVAPSAQTYPSKPIRLIVPFAPGGPADIQARLIGPKLTEAWGQPVVVENRPGGNTLIATELTARADPDGHLVQVISAGFAINVSLYAKLPYDSVRDFAPVTQLTSGPAIAVVHPSLPARSIKELIALAKARPGQLTYASAGLPSQLAVELFKVLTGTEMVHVPYKGQSPAMIDLIAGHVQVSFPTMLGTLGHVEAGRLRALATTGAKRAPAAPNLPTMIEAGVPGYVATNWFGTAVPAKTPPAIVARLSQEIARVLRLPDVGERLLTQGLEPASSTPEEFSAYIRSEMTKWAKVVKASGAKAE